MGNSGDIEQFIAQWRDTGGSELANTQSFINGLCQLIGVDGATVLPDNVIPWPVTLPEQVSAVQQVCCWAQGPHSLPKTSHGPSRASAQQASARCSMHSLASAWHAGSRMEGMRLDGKTFHQAGKAVQCKVS